MASDSRSQWSAARFLTTLNYFGEIPFLGNFRWIQQLLGQRAPFPGMNLSTSQKTVVVIGDQSSQADKTVCESLKQKLSSTVKLIFYPSDSILAARPNHGNLPATQAAFETVSQTPISPAVSWCRLLSLADTVIVLDVPSAPTLVADMTALIGSSTTLEEQCNLPSPVVERSVFDFSEPACDLGAWGALDDVVMGGVSQGNFFLKPAESMTDGPPGQAVSAERQPAQSDQVAVFAGYVSTDNSGGFSSVRTRNFDPPFDFSGWRGLRLMVKGDGQRYKFIARNSQGWDSPAYICAFDTVVDTWCDVDIPFTELVATFRARSVPNAPAFDPGKVLSLQLMLSKFEYDRRLNPRFEAGPFELAVRRMSVYRPRRGVPLVVVGASDQARRSQQQAVLTEAQISYQFIEPGRVEVLEALAAALT